MLSWISQILVNLYQIQSRINEQSKSALMQRFICDPTKPFREHWCITLLWTSKLKMSQAKEGISQYYSPRTILGQRTLDYKKECTIPFWAYVQAHSPIQPNSNAPWALDAIYIHPSQNIQGGHKVLDLATGHITFVSVTEILISNTIIVAVEEMAFKHANPTY